MKIYGYIIQDKDEDYLNGDLGWVPHPRPEDAFVHPENKLERILKDLRGCKSKPTKLTKAAYDNAKNTTEIISFPKIIENITARQLKEWIG